MHIYQQRARRHDLDELVRGTLAATETPSGTCRDGLLVAPSQHAGEDRTCHESPSRDRRDLNRRPGLAQHKRLRLRLQYRKSVNFLDIAPFDHSRSVKGAPDYNSRSYTR